MSAYLGRESHDRSANPLDIIEQIIASNEWAFDRRNDSEIAAEAPGNGATTGCISPGRMRSARCISPAPST